MFEQRFVSNSYGPWSILLVSQMYAARYFAGLLIPFELLPSCGARCNHLDFIYSELFMDDVHFSFLDY